MLSATSLGRSYHFSSSLSPLQLLFKKAWIPFTNMEYYDKTEFWEFPGDHPFLYTNVIFQDDDNYFWTQLPERSHLLDPANIE